MLDTTIKRQYSGGTPLRDPYELAIPICREWKNTRNRLLIIAQHVAGVDLREKRIMGHQLTKQTTLNAIKYTRKLAKPYLAADNSALPNFAYCVANGNLWKHFDLQGPKRASHVQAFATEAHELIKRLKPTHVLVCGDEIYQAMYPSVEYPQYKRGWIFKRKLGDSGYRVTSTVDLYSLIDQGGSLSNLLGFFCRDLMNLQLGKNPHDLSHIKAKPFYADTMEKVDKVLAKMAKAELVAVDTETRNLSVLHNALFTVQLACDTDKGYIIPVDHPRAHWSNEERKEIKRKLRKFFAAKKGPMLTTFNGMFDLRVLRQELKIPFMWHKVWEVMFGEHGLDENYQLLNDAPTVRLPNGKMPTFGGLLPTACRYGNDFYLTAAFGKEERDTIGGIDPRNKDFHDYASMDVQLLCGIVKQQISRAAKTEFVDQKFKPYFVRHMKYQMSDTAHTLSHLKSDGSKISRAYLKKLKGKDSPLVSELKRAELDFIVHKEVREANQQLLSASGLKSKGLFGRVASSWLFNLNKGDHKKKLFLDVLGLEPVNKTKTGEPAIDKAFIANYKDKNKIVSLYGEYQALSKLLSTYVKGWWKILINTQDAATDDHLRPDYGVVDTGRLNSRGPNLQQIPSRGKLAKIIKEMFIAPQGTLLIRYDYSAHEVRMWAVVAGDKVLAEAFRIGQKLRQMLIKNPTDEIRKRIKMEGDLHIINVKRFFNKQVDKEHPLRDAVKGVVFGTIYGKSAATLGEDTKTAEIGALRKKIGEQYDLSLKLDKEGDKAGAAAARKAMDELDEQLTTLMAEDRTEYAQGIVDKMFDQFRRGKQWIDRMIESALERYYVYSPTGRRRFLPAAMVGDRGIVSQQVRRSANAPIQGFASEVGVAAARLVMEYYYGHLEEMMKLLGINSTPWKMRVAFSRMVHDANYFAVPYVMVLPFIHMLQYGATYGIANRIERRFNVKMPVEPEIEVEVAANDARSMKWDWTLPALVNILQTVIHDADGLGVLTGTKTEVYDEVMRAWREPKVRRYLQENFPLLGVTDLDKEIAEVARTKYADPKVEEKK